MEFTRTLRLRREPLLALSNDELRHLAAGTTGNICTVIDEVTRAAGCTPVTPVVSVVIRCVRPTCGPGCTGTSETHPD